MYVGEPAAPTPDEDLAVHALLDGPLLDRKLDALSRQASQTERLRAALGDAGFRDFIATEAFRARERPATDVRARPLTMT